MLPIGGQALMDVGTSGNSTTADLSACWLVGMLVVPLMISVD